MSSTKRFPNFLIVGAAKSGTTTLHQLLKDHPQVYLPARKELNFWYTHGREDWAILKRFPDLPMSLEDYLGYFETNCTVVGEAAPSYLIYHEAAIANLKKFHPNPDALKIVIILREPIAKIWSHYKMVKRAAMDPDGLDLAESLKQEKVRKTKPDYLPDTLPLFSTDYLTQIKAYKEAFKSVKVLLFDDLKNRLQELLDELGDFLEVDRIEHPNIGQKYNAAPQKAIQYSPFFEGIRKLGLNRLVPTGIKEIRRKRLRKLQEEEKMDPVVRQHLANHYRPHITALQNLVELDLSHWLDQYQ